MSIEELDPDSIKFHSCKFRSESEITRTIRRCPCQGGDYNANGFWCEKREIFQVNAYVCKECTEYESK